MVDVETQVGETRFQIIPERDVMAVGWTRSKRAGSTIAVYRPTS